MSDLSILVICAAESIIKQVPVFAVCSDTFISYQEKKFNYFLDEVKKGTANLNFDTLNGNVAPHRLSRQVNSNIFTK